MTLKAEPSAEDQTPIPQERANQLELLLSSLAVLGENFATGVERAFLEIAVRIRARRSLPDWVNGAGQLLQLVSKHTEKLNSFSTAELGRLFRSLASIAAAQMELGPEPAVPRRSLAAVWILGYKLVKSMCESSNDQDRIFKLLLKQLSVEKKVEMFESTSFV